MPDSNANDTDLQQAKALTTAYRNKRKKRLTQANIPGIPLLAIILGASIWLIVGAATGGLGIFAGLALAAVALIAGTALSKVTEKRNLDFDQYQKDYISGMNNLGYALSEPKPSLLSKIKNFFGIHYHFVYSNALDIDSFVKKTPTETISPANTAPPQIAPAKAQSILPTPELPKKTSNDKSSHSSPTSTQAPTDSKGFR